MTSVQEDIALAFEAAPLGLIVSRRRVIGLCNGAIETMFGFTRAELVGRSLLMLYPTQAEFERIGARGLPAMRESGAYSDERIMRRKDGALFWCHVTGRAIDRDDPFECSVWAFEDISARRPASAALTRREREVARLIAAGLTSKEIAREIGASPRTVEAHRARLMRKFDARSGAQLIARLAGAPG
jgi:PAS domain S-box-containing protein